MENTPLNVKIKDEIYKLFVEYSLLDVKEVLQRLEAITKDVKKQNKEVKKNG
mgnify:CR=1 FL=1